MYYTELNAKLVEEFGNLERLCNQIYNTQHGVTSYIDDMECAYNSNTYVTSWERELKQLKNVRHKRNQLSHGEVSFGAPCAKQEDIDFIMNFRNSILRSSDPLALYRRLSQPKSTLRTYSTPSSYKTIYRQQKQHYSQPTGCVLCLTLVVIITVAVISLILQI